jgi:polysaccharide export outer membrane protein
MRKIFSSIAMLMMIAATSLGISAQTASPSGDDAPAKDATAALPMSVAGPTYVIGPADTLHISVWKELELSNTLPVRPDGKISMPLLNDVQAAGLTPMELAASITEKLKKFVADPRVTVVVTAMNSQRYFVTGEVLHTGAAVLLPNMTVLQALATAGFSQFANTKSIYVLRAVNGTQQKIPVNYRRLVKGEAMNQNIVLKPGDTVVVP